MPEELSSFINQAINLLPSQLRTRREHLESIERERIQQEELRRAHDRLISPSIVAEPQEFQGLASRYSVDTGFKLCSLCKIEGLRSCCVECNKTLGGSYIHNSTTDSNGQVVGRQNYRNGVWYTGTTMSEPFEIRRREATSLMIAELQHSNEILNAWRDISNNIEPLDIEF